MKGQWTTDNGQWTGDGQRTTDNRQRTVEQPSFVFGPLSSVRCPLSVVLLFLVFCPLSVVHCPASAQEPIRIGSKKFTESYILAEIMAQKIEKELKIKVVRRHGLGGTFVAFEALRTGAIDCYPEYSGTALEVLLKTKEDLDFDGMNRLLKKREGVEWLKPFGFNNSYALAIPANKAGALRIEKYSDLVNHPDLRWALSYEFLNREDGWPALKTFYGFNPRGGVRGMEHTLSYEAVKNNFADLMDVYSTDAKVATYGLRVLEDDKKFFPRYFGAPLVHSAVLEKVPWLRDVLNTLAGTIDDEKMRELNAAAEIEGKSFEKVAREFLAKEKEEASNKIEWSVLWERTLQHLKLTFLSVLLAGLLGIPLGIAMRRVQRLAAPILYATGIVQTIPSIALLALMIPLFGVGEVPALVALFLYGLLPIVRNTYIGLKEIAPSILEAADGIGLRPSKKLIFVELPLALPTILAGVKTSAVINIGTATLAAFIGAGGLGEPIVTGLALHNTGLILQGAIPAALLAIFTEYGLGLFELSFSWKRVK